jgi:hypothetical protein
MESGYRAAVDCGARVWWCHDVMEREGFSVDEEWALFEGLVEKQLETPRVLVGLSLDGWDGPFSTGMGKHAITFERRLGMSVLTL